MNKPFAMHSKISTPEMDAVFRARQPFKLAALVITYLFLFTSPGSSTNIPCRYDFPTTEGWKAHVCVGRCRVGR